MQEFDVTLAGRARAPIRDGARMTDMGRASLAIGVLLCATSTSRAECIVPLPPCDALKTYAIVVVVDVLDEQGRWNPPFGPQKLVLRPIDRFKGVPDEASELSVVIRWEVETVPLRKGQRF